VFTEKVFVVSLARRADRYHRFLANYRESGAEEVLGKAELYRAIDAKRVKGPPWFSAGNPAWGCLRSHTNLIEQALNENWESLLLLEDDALFGKDFPEQFTKFREGLSHLSPQDSCDMFYLGGQHYKALVASTIKVTNHVYRAYNVNRTHAFGFLTRKGMSACYKHLFSQNWLKRHHIDHHLGRFHEQHYRQAEDPANRVNVYVPQEWIVGQAEGKSDILYRNVPQRYWNNQASVNINDAKWLAILGPHSSGSSAIAGVCHHLGVHVGDVLVGYYGRDPSKFNCGYEPKGLADLL
jgi:hypothetical protein